MLLVLAGCVGPVPQAEQSAPKGAGQAIDIYTEVRVMSADEVAALTHRYDNVEAWLQAGREHVQTLELAAATQHGAVGSSSSALSAAAPALVLGPAGWAFFFVATVVTTCAGTPACREMATKVFESATESLFATAPVADESAQIELAQSVFAVEPLGFSPGPLNEIDGQEAEQDDSAPDKEAILGGAIATVSIYSAARALLNALKDLTLDGTDESRCNGRPPLLLIHGNGSPLWDVPINDGALRQRIVTDLYGGDERCIATPNYLSEAERTRQFSNQHTAVKAGILVLAMAELLSAHEAPQVDIVAHSMGATLVLQALNLTTALVEIAGDRAADLNLVPQTLDLWLKVRRMVLVGAGLRGMRACREFGFDNPAVRLCAGQHIGRPGTFGFYPASLTGKAFPGSFPTAASFNYRTANRRLDSDGFPAVPGLESASQTEFFVISAGDHDQLFCSNISDEAHASGCEHDTLLNAGYSNVLAQLDVGHGTHPWELDPTTDPSVFPTEPQSNPSLLTYWRSVSSFFLRLPEVGTMNLLGADGDGIGHVNLTTHTNQIHLNMLGGGYGTSGCRGEACCQGHSGPECRLASGPTR